VSVFKGKRKAVIDLRNLNFLKSSVSELQCRQGGAFSYIHSFIEEGNGSQETNYRINEIVISTLL